MTTFLKIVLLVLATIVALKLLPCVLALGGLVAGLLAGVLFLGGSIVAMIVGILALVVAVLAPLWIPVLLVVGIIALFRQGNRSRSVHG